MKAVNLLSRDPKPAAGRWPAWGTLALLALALAVGLSVTALVYTRAEGRVARNDDRLATMHRQLALMEAARQPARAEAPALQGLREAVLATLDGRESWGGLLRGVGRVMPDGAWLTKLTLTQPGVSIEAGGSSPSPTAPPVPEPAPTGEALGEVSLSLVGCALGQGQVGRAVNGVNLLPGASGVSVSSTQTATADSSCGRHPSFQLSFSVAGGTS